VKREFDERVVLVTGSSSGIGRAAALAFAREGAKVVVNGSANIEGGEETVRMIKETGGDAIFIRADVSKAQEVEAMMKRIVDSYGRLDCAYNNAGGSRDFAPTADYTEEEWDRNINLNLKGVWLCMKYEIREMLKQGKGAIVNCSSVVGLVGHDAGVSAYCAAKHGVIGLTKVAALEYARREFASMHSQPAQ
jgi:NAD(P)-dependent dehydrogenase (short-subunit alcohol dehydrogenase family)